MLAMSLAVTLFAVSEIGTLPPTGTLFGSMTFHLIQPHRGRSRSAKTGVIVGAVSNLLPTR
jgi:hypothetical protein